ncbi:hypothetical protein QBC46DRAFT_346761 [Diplogelasinospora grovesii]|uniref:Uncharacterized protein n=1 Tax=Diplogelasinospora grovesii TaxID=303347 RepID=A0AAN6MYZ3_9PEZI|nr:hypothetical protein QBC46DRAFT_346761 [Diplogelasinospora grovesii]
MSLNPYYPRRGFGTFRVYNNDKQRDHHIALNMEEIMIKFNEQGGQLELLENSFQVHLQRDREIEKRVIALEAQIDELQKTVDALNPKKIKNANIHLNDVDYRLASLRRNIKNLEVHFAQVPNESYAGQNFIRGGAAAAAAAIIAAGNSAGSHEGVASPKKRKQGAGASGPATHLSDEKEKLVHIESMYDQVLQRMGELEVNVAESAPQKKAKVADDVEMKFGEDNTSKGKEVVAFTGKGANNSEDTAHETQGQPEA